MKGGFFVDTNLTLCYYFEVVREAVDFGPDHNPRTQEFRFPVSNSVIEGFRLANGEGVPAFRFRIFDVNAQVEDELGSWMRRVKGYVALRGVVYNGVVVVSLDVKHPLYLYEVVAKPKQPLTSAQRDRQPAVAFEVRAGEDETLEVLHNQAGETPDLDRETLVVNIARRLFPTGEKAKDKKHKNKHKKRVEELKGFLARNLPGRNIQYEESTKVRI